MADSKEVLKKIQHDHGAQIAQMGGDDYCDTPRLPTGIFPFDLASGGGFPMGRASIIYGPESCLDSNTFIQYEIKTTDGKRQNHKGGTIENLYHRFNGIPKVGRGNYQRACTVSSVFTVPCVNEVGRIFHNRIVGVVKAGEKECLEVTTSSGLRIIATADHKFHVGSGFVRLGDLVVGDQVMIHNNLRFMAVEDTIESMVPVGVRMTYDIQMESPHNNFVAAGFVVHNSNKTNMALCAIAQGQRLYSDKNAVFVDAEHALDLPWARKLGVDTDRLIVLHPEFAEQAVDFIESFLYATDVFVVVLDSLAALTTQNEIESSAEKVIVGGASLLAGKLFKKATVSFNRLRNQGVMPPAFIAINQIRFKIGVMFGNPETMPGGQAPKFASSMTVRVYGKNVLDKKLNAAMPAIKTVSCVLQKWKVPILSSTAEYNMQMLEYNGNNPGFVADWNTISTYLKQLDYLGKGKDYWSLFGQQHKTLEECRKWLYADPGMLLEAKQTIIAELLAKGGVAVGEEEEAAPEI